MHPAAPAPRPVPRVAARVLAVALAAVVLGAVHLRERPSTLCPLRAVTGVPCPFCGGTTAVADLGRGDLTAAVAASPLALVLVGALPFVRHVAPPSRRQLFPSRRLRAGVVIAVLVLAELWQLARFGLLG